MDNLFYWFHGYVVIQVKGIDFSRFLYLCSKNNLQVHHVFAKEPDLCTCSMRISDYFMVRPFRRKAKVSIKIIKKVGIFNWFHILLQHKCLLFIATLGIVIVLYMSQLIWRIDIRGINQIEEKEIISVLKKHDCYITQKIDKIHCAELEKVLQCEIEEIAWISIYKSKHSIGIDIKEKITYDGGIHD